MVNLVGAVEGGLASGLAAPQDPNRIPEQPQEAVDINKMNEELLDKSFSLEKELFPNLMEGLSKDKLLEIGEQAIQGYQTDIDSRQEWEKAQAKYAKMFALQRDPKDFPWPDCSNVAMPMLSMACTQYKARAFEELVPAKGIVKEIPFQTNADMIDIAKRKSKYMNYLLMVKDTLFKRSMDTSLLKQSIEGHTIRKTYYDPVRRKVVSDYVSTTDFVVNANTRWLETSERYTQRLWLTENDLRMRVNQKIYKGDEELFGDESFPLDDVKIQHLKNVGIEASVDSQDSIKMRLILEQTVLLSLGGAKTIKKPYIITVDYNTSRVLRIVSRINPKSGKVMEFYTDYPFIPNPAGFYGLGFGLFLESLNEALTSITNMLLDAGTLQNLQTGYVLKGTGMKRGTMEVAMGKLIEIDPGGSDDIRKMMSTFDFGAPSPVLYSMLGVLQQYADRFTTVTDQQTGNAQKSDTTATGIAILVEQGLKFFSDIHRRNHMAFQQELKKIEELNALYLDVEEYYKVAIDPRDLVNPETKEQIPKMQVMEMLKADFQTDNMVIPVSNPNIISKQEVVAKAQFVYTSALESPITANNPQAIWEAQRALYEAMDIPEAEIEKFLPVPASQEPQDLPQEEENQMFLNDQYVEPLEQQDHQGHLKVMDEFEVSPFFESLTATGKKFFDQHKRAHLGFLYIMSAGQKITSQQPQQPNSQPQVQS